MVASAFAVRRIAIRTIITLDTMRSVFVGRPRTQSRPGSRCASPPPGKSPLTVYGYRDFTVTEHDVFRDHHRGEPLRSARVRIVLSASAVAVAPRVGKMNPYAWSPLFRYVGRRRSPTIAA